MKVISIDSLKKFYNKLSTIFAKKSDIKTVNINNNLTTTTSGSALDATQGKVLDNKITDLKNLSVMEKVLLHPPSLIKELAHRRMPHLILLLVI